jgi:uncharacterized membrane protein
MYCTNCGERRPDKALICPACQARIQQFAGPADIPNYLVQSILVTFCCCLPLGIVAVVYSAQVNAKVAAGDIAGAQQASRSAKLWGWIAFGFGAVAAVISIAFNLLNAGLGN